MDGFPDGPRWPRSTDPRPQDDAPDHEANLALETWDEAITSAETLIARVRRHYTMANAEFCAGGMCHARMHEIQRALEVLGAVVTDLEDAVSMTEALS